jgi:hypothetical protein
VEVMQNASVPRKSRKPVSARLFPIFARKAPIAVIFRRGPSKWVQLIKWNTDSDTFEFGQWFHGRIYERRGDLSPDGSFLIYFAQKINARTLQESKYAWTAISRPPYLTALALWLQNDCWDGGGLFHSQKSLHLNHFVNEPHPDHKPPGWLHIRSKMTARGEDEPIFSERIQRDGWELKQEWKVENHGYPKYFVTTQKEIREKSNRNGKLIIRLIRSIKRFNRIEVFSVTDPKGSFEKSIEDTSWADWDRGGRLVFLRDGKVFAASLTDHEGWDETLLADLNPSKPEPMVAPRRATRW